VFGESDTAAHHFWHLHDRHSPRRRGADVSDDPILAVYRRLDRAIAELEEAAMPSAVMVLSDHGFGGASDRAVYLNGCLAELGLQRRQSSRSVASSTLKKLALTAIPASLQAQLFRLGDGKWASRLESRSRFAGIDWDSTSAFSEELNYYPNVWLNLAGREPRGKVGRNDYERVRDDVCAALLSLRDPQTGQPIVQHAWRREEIYHGPLVENAPDILLELALVEGYSYTCLPSSSNTAGTVVRQMSANELGGGKVAGMSGSHRADGMFIFTAAQAGRTTLKIEDCGAMVLAHCGVELPADLDGRPMNQSTATGEVAQCVISEVPYAAAEESEIEQRLGALGYLQ